MSAEPSKQSLRKRSILVTKTDCANNLVAEDKSTIAKKKVQFTSNEEFVCFKLI